MLAYLARYTHRVAISNSRLIALDEAGVTFKWKDYRIRDRLKTMTLNAAEFIRRFQRRRHAWTLLLLDQRAGRVGELPERLRAAHRFRSL